MFQRIFKNFLILINLEKGVWVPTYPLETVTVYVLEYLKTFKDILKNFREFSRYYLENYKQIWSINIRKISNMYEGCSKSKVLYFLSFFLGNTEINC